MKLISVEQTRLTSLVLASRPEGQIYAPVTTSDIVERYGFVEFPKDYAAMKREKVEFIHGRFGNTSIESLEIYSDGFVISSRVNSNLLENFLEDLTQYMKESWGVEFTTANRVNRLYDSSLVFQSDANILAPLHQLNSLSQKLSKKLHQSSGAEVSFEPFGMSLSAESIKIPALKPVPFRIERREGTEFHYNLYFSTAPLRSDDHIALLEEWEGSI